MNVLGSYRFLLNRSWILKIPYLVWSVFILGFLSSLWFMPSDTSVKIVTLVCIGVVCFFIYRAYVTETHLRCLIHEIEPQDHGYSLRLVGGEIEIASFSCFSPVDATIKRDLQNLHNLKSQLYVASIEGRTIYLSSEMANFDSIAHLFESDNLQKKREDSL